jgi:hypothetical protein
MKIEITQEGTVSDGAGGHFAPGHGLDVPDDVAESLIAKGLAKAAGEITADAPRRLKKVGQNAG